MHRSKSIISLSRVLIFTIGVLMVISLVILTSIAQLLFPTYFVYYIVGILIFILFSRIDFEIFQAFSLILYVLSIGLLCLPLLMGEITRGAVRWIELGPITIQPSEIVRPFVFLFFARFLFLKKLSFQSVLQGFIIFALPVLLILIQPSFGVAMLTTIGLVGVFFASNVPKKYFFGAILCAIVAIPVVWLVLAPYQRQRVESFINPAADPLGAGYNSMQSMISIGSGKIFGRGLGEGIQTQLAFLPEKHSDFVFAAVSEEMGLVGALLLLITLFIFFWCLIYIIEHVKYLPARAYTAGVCLSLFAETIIHAGMNMGMLPITGVPLPLVSAGGSALIGTMMSLGIVISSWKSHIIRTQG
jgi:rod shape determining protein RodA